MLDSIIHPVDAMVKLLDFRKIKFSKLFRDTIGEVFPCLNPPMSSTAYWSAHTRLFDSNVESNSLNQPLPLALHFLFLLSHFFQSLFRLNFLLLQLIHNVREILNIKSSLLGSTSNYIFYSLLPLLSRSLPVHDELFKRSILFAQWLCG